MTQTKQCGELKLIQEGDAARILGVSPATLKAARLRQLPANPLRELPHVRIGRSVRYRPSDIVDWIDRHVIDGVTR